MTLPHNDTLRSLSSALQAARELYAVFETGNDYDAMIPIVGVFAALSPQQRLGVHLYGTADHGENNGRETGKHTLGDGVDTLLQRSGTVKTTRKTTVLAFLDALDNAIADVPRLRPIATPLLGPMWTSELKNLLMVLRSLVANRSTRTHEHRGLPQHLHLPFLDGMARLHGMYEQLITLDIPDESESLPNPPTNGEDERVASEIEPKASTPEYSQSMTRKEARRRLGSPSPAAFSELLTRYGFDQLNRQSIRLRLDTMDSATRARFESRT